MVKTAKEGMKQQATNSEIYGKMHEVFIQMDSDATETVTPKTKVFFFLSVYYLHYLF